MHPPLFGEVPEDAPVRGVVVYNQDPSVLQVGLHSLHIPVDRPQDGRRGNGKVKGGAFAGFALDPDAPIHHLAEPLADSQAQPGAAVVARGRGIDLAERLEQPLKSWSCAGLMGLVR